MTKHRQVVASLGKLRSLDAPDLKLLLINMLPALLSASSNFGANEAPEWAYKGP